MSNLPKIAAVVVTHNRLPLLKECVEALKNQSTRLNEIIIVDNASTDGTGEWLGTQTDLIIVKQENLGSAGGQYNGIKTAYDRGHDWIWCMDDDTLPTPTALEFLIKCPYFKGERTGFLSSVVLWKDGTMHEMNIPGTAYPTKWMHRVLEEKCLELVHNSFVSVLINRRAVAKVGLPIREFFIWGDDVEYTGRITKFFNGYVVLESKVIHQTKENMGGGSQQDLADYRSLKIKYLYQNQVLLTLLDNANIFRRLKRIIVGTIREFFRVKSTGRRFAIFRYSLSGFYIYFKVRRKKF